MTSNCFITLIFLNWLRLNFNLEYISNYARQHNLNNNSSKTVMSSKKESYHTGIEITLGWDIFNFRKLFQ